LVVGVSHTHSAPYLSAELQELLRPHGLRIMDDAYADDVLANVAAAAAEAAERTVPVTVQVGRAPRRTRGLESPPATAGWPGGPSLWPTACLDACATRGVDRPECRHDPPGGTEARRPWRPSSATPVIRPPPAATTTATSPPTSWGPGESASSKLKRRPACFCRAVPGTSGPENGSAAAAERTRWPWAAGSLAVPSRSGGLGRDRARRPRGSRRAGSRSTWSAYP